MSEDITVPIDPYGLLFLSWNVGTTPSLEIADGFEEPEYDGTGFDLGAPVVGPLKVLG